MSMAAQNVQVLFGPDRDNLQVAQNGQTYQAACHVDDTYADMDIYFYQQEANLWVRGNIGTEVLVTVTAHDHAVDFCGINGQCVTVEAGQDVTKSGFLEAPVQETDEAFVEGNVVTESLDIHYQNAMDPTTQPTEDITIDVYVENLDDDEEIYEVTVVMLASTNGISSVMVNKDQIKVVNNTLVYNVSKASTLKVYGITGSMAAKYQISGSGTLSLNNLPKGIYLYTDGTNKGKFIVK